MAALCLRRIADTVAAIWDGRGTTNDSLSALVQNAVRRRYLTPCRGFVLGPPKEDPKKDRKPCATVREQVSSQLRRRSRYFCQITELANAAATHIMARFPYSGQPEEVEIVYTTALLVFGVTPASPLQHPRVPTTTQIVLLPSLLLSPSSSSESSSPASPSASLSSSASSSSLSPNASRRSLIHNARSTRSERNWTTSGVSLSSSSRLQ